MPLLVKDFVGSVVLLAWAKGCAGLPWTADTCAAVASVGRCRLTVSKPVLKAPLVSALGSTM